MKLGNYALLKVNGSLISGQVDSSLSSTVDMIGVVKEGGRYKEVIADRASTSVSVTILHDDTVFETLWNAHVNGTRITVTYGGINAGEKYLSFSGYISAMNKSDAKNALSTITVEIISDGEITLNTN
jgi:hypothetical protein